MDDGGVYHAASEHGCTVHHYAIAVRPMGGVGKGYGGVSTDAVVGTGEN